MSNRTTKTPNPWQRPDNNAQGHELFENLRTVVLRHYAYAIELRPLLLRINRVCSGFFWSTNVPPPVVHAG
jgi:hypothetical protein